MDSLQQPSVLAMPFANNGDKNVIPSSPTGSNLASLSEGFPEVTGKPIASGGVPPSRADFNALGNISTLFYYFMQCGGSYTFRADVSTAIGGYPKDALLWYIPVSGNPNILRSTINNNTNNFISDPSVIGSSGSGKPWEIVTSSSVSPNIGSGINPVYTNALGVLTASSSTVGSLGNPIYMDNGEFKPVQSSQVHVVVESYKSGYDWYRIYDDGWCEQGGVTSFNVNAETVTLHKEFSDTNYSVMATSTGLTNSSTDTGGRDLAPETSDFTTTSFRISQYKGTARCSQWRAEGFIS